MKRIFSAVLVALLATSCVNETAIYGYGNLEPIPGSITYGGQPRTKLKKAPVGSPVHNSFYGTFGERIEETYIIQPDRSLKLVSRYRQPIWDAIDD